MSRGSSKANYTYKQERSPYFLKTTVSGNPDAKYELQSFEKLNQNPKFSFGKSDRFEKDIGHSVGPGQYDYIH